jgi:hypothetical protein
MGAVRMPEAVGEDCWNALALYEIDVGNGV